MAKTPAQTAAPDATPAQVEVTIFRGTYSTADGNFGPGKTVTVDADEAQRLKDLGFVKADTYVEPDEVQDGTLKILAEDGPTVTTTVTGGAAS